MPGVSGPTVSIDPGGEVPVGVLDETALTLRYLPSGPPASDDATWLSGLWAFRGLAMYDQDLCPWFRQPDGSYRDADAHDRGAYHCLARGADGALIGSVRLGLLGDPRGGKALSVLGDEQITPALQRMGDPVPDSVAEFARLAVHPGHRGRRVASLLVAMVIATARAAGRRYALGFVGTRMNQHLFVARYGCRELGCERWFPHEGELARLMWCDLTAAAGEREQFVAAVHELLEPALSEITRTHESESR
jgi:GNAT superfamily N-acetyltransferase